MAVENISIATQSMSVSGAQKQKRTNFLFRSIYSLSIWRFAAFFIIASVRLASQSLPYPSQLGDLDGDGQVTVADVVVIVNHILGTPRLTTEMSVFADVNQDGVVNDADVEMTVDSILGLTALQQFPLTRILETSPSDGESKVAITRETVIRFTQPLSQSAHLNGDQFFAEFAG